MKIINNFHKLVSTEAPISDKVCNICSGRLNETKIFIKNSFKKFQKIEVIKPNDENIFYTQYLA